MPMVEQYLRADGNGAGRDTHNQGQFIHISALRARAVDPGALPLSACDARPRFFRNFLPRGTVNLERLCTSAQTAGSRFRLQNHEFCPLIAWLECAVAELRSNGFFHDCYGVKGEGFEFHILSKSSLPWWVMIGGAGKASIDFVSIHPGLEDSCLEDLHVDR